MDIYQARGEILNEEIKLLVSEKLTLEQQKKRASNSAKKCKS